MLDKSRIAPSDRRQPNNGRSSPIRSGVFARVRPSELLLLPHHSTTSLVCTITHTSLPDYTSTMHHAMKYLSTRGGEERLSFEEVSLAMRRLCSSPRLGGAGADGAATERLLGRTK